MDAHAAQIPTVKLKPGKARRRLERGAPWAYRDEVALDRRTKALAPGSIVRLAGPGEAGPVGTAAFNPESQIALRLLDPDPEAVIDGAWLEARIGAALGLRERLYDAPFYRLVHAEGDGLPGVVIDRFGAVAVIQPNAAWADRLIEPLTDALTAAAGVATVVVNATARGRRLEGLDEHLTVMRDAVEGPIPVPMNGATYLADVTGGQKTGLFYDQRPNHAFVAGLAKGARVLDVFAHVGGFALAALARGAAHAIAVDSSAPALALAAAGARETGVADRLETRRADAFDAMEALATEGARFEVVVCDPPAFAPSKAALEQGLRAYARTARLAAGLVSRGGFLTLCSCSHAADPESFLDACREGLAKAGRSGALIASGRAGPDHPQHPGLPETSYLKALTFRLA